MTFLCLASYEKGHEFLREANRQSVHVVLLTSLSLKDKANWPMNSVTEIFYMPDQDHQWNRDDVIKAVSFLARTRDFDRIIALDDFDVEMAAHLREHLRVPGMGESRVRYFRDKLAMRIAAREAAIQCRISSTRSTTIAFARFSIERRRLGCSSRVRWPELSE